MCGASAIKTQRDKLHIIPHAMGSLPHDAPQAKKSRDHRKKAWIRALVVVQLLVLVPRNHENQKTLLKKR